MNRLLRLLVLAAVWVALWGEVTAANVVWGLVVATVIAVAYPSTGGGNGFRPGAALRLLASFAAMLVSSTGQVVIEVLRPRLRLVEAIIAVPLHTDDPVIVTMVANGISLTPGTLTVDVGLDLAAGGRRVLYVHTLRVISPGDVAASAHRLEQMACAAFPPPIPGSNRLPDPESPS